MTTMMAQMLVMIAQMNTTGEAPVMGTSTLMARQHSPSYNSETFLPLPQAINLRAYQPLLGECHLE